MPIIAYSGPFKQDGSLHSFTRVMFECDDCHTIRETTYAAYKKGTGKCIVCAKYGPPRRVEDVICQYPCIQKVLTFDKRGGVVNKSRLIARCTVCNVEHETNLQSVRQLNGTWRCRSCSKIPHGNGIVMPNDLPEYVLDYETDTLGSLGRMVSDTVVYIECPECGAVIQRTWSNVLARGHSVCGDCQRKNIHNDPEWREMMHHLMKALWQDEEFRKFALEQRRSNGGYISGLHADVKSKMGECGLSQFQSEQYVAGVGRVDELDREGKVVVEVFGDFWHFNPALYDADQVVMLDGVEVRPRNVWARDHRRIENLKALGYSVYIVWESDFRENPKGAVDDLMEWLRGVPQPSIRVLEKIPSLGLN